jgi:YidC/Oxa1 family membrane protein insertase
MKRQIITFILIFLVLMILFRGCSGNQELEANLAGNDVGIATLNEEYRQDGLVSVKLRNNTNSAITIPSECPEEPLNVFRYRNGEWKQLHVEPQIECPDIEEITIPSGEELTIEYGSWNHALFHEIGRYKISVEAEVDGEVKEFESNEFTVTKKAWWSYLWTTFFYQPIFNSLIYIISVMPGYNLGLAIIVLTFIIKLILFFPSQRGLESQRKLQELQPRIKKLQEKYKDNQQKLAQETFALYKEYKVNPFGSCLPLIIQLPILIALFFVIKSGLNPDNVHLLYEPLKGFDFSAINTNFYGLLNLTERNVFALPLAVAGLQFLQMKLATSRKNKKKEEEQKKAGKKEMEQKSKGPEMQMATEMMTYIMPVMLALFTASVPSGVGLYWGTSTVFGIGQQLYVNKKVSKKKNKSTKVKVIEKNK